MAPLHHKRAASHGDRTNEVFRSELLPDQGSDDGKARSIAARSEGNSPTVTSDGCVSPPASMERQRQDMTVEEKPVRISFLDMHHGLVQGKDLPARDGPGPPSGDKLCSAAAGHPWNAFDALSPFHHRKAAKDTIRYLGQRLQFYTIDTQDSEPEILPFLNEEQLIKMVKKTEACVRWIVESRQPQDSKRPQKPLSAQAVNPSTSRTTLYDTDSAPLEDKGGQKWEQKVDAEHQHRAETTRLWGVFLMQENRRLREKWLSDVEGDDRAILMGKNPAMRCMYETIKAENGIPFHSRMSMAGLDGELERSIEKNLAKIPHSGYDAAHLQKDGTLLASPDFAPIATKHVQDWCTGGSVELGSHRVGEQFGKLVRNATGLPIHAWTSALPPVWNDEQGSWIWRGFSSTKPSEEQRSVPSSGSHERVDSAKRELGSPFETRDNLHAGRDASVSLDGKAQSPERPLGLTKNQKRAKARKGKKVTGRNILLEAGVQSLSDDVADLRESRSGVGSTSSRVVIRDGTAYRVSAAPRVDLDTAIKLATKGRLRVSMCPALETGDADHLLKACARFRSGIDARGFGKDPHVMTRFLMKAELKPSGFEEALEVERFLRAMKKLEPVQTVDQAVVGDTADPEESLHPEDEPCAECKAMERAAAAAAAAAAASADTTTAPLAEFDSTGPVAYPGPPAILDREHMIPWAHSLTGAQLASLQTKEHRTLGLRALVLAARLLIFQAARQLTPEMFERVVSPSFKVVDAMDLPVAKYSLGRSVISTQIMRQAQARYVAERRHNRRRQKDVVAARVPVPDYPARAATHLNSRYETVVQMVARARILVYSSQHVDAVIGAVDAAFDASEPSEPSEPALETERADSSASASAAAAAAAVAEARPNRKDPHTCKLLPQPPSASLMRRLDQTVADMAPLADERADAVMAFLARWPMLEGVVTGRESCYVPVGPF